MGTPLPVKYTPTGVLAEVEVGGADLSGVVQRLSIDHAAGEAPKVFLELKKGVPVESVLVDAMVHVREVVQEDAADACLRFLELVDPGELERCSLAAMELGGPATFGEAALAVMKQWARGD